MNDIIQTITIYAIPIIFAITLHEAAHGYVARHFGDATAYLQGRVTLNPLKHIDPLGTIAIPIVLAILTAGQFVFGYAKPVPVSFANLNNPKRDMIWVALAGPGSNFAQAFLWALFGVGLALGNVSEPYFFAVASAGVLVNLVMLALNLFPLPPLDGGRVLTGLLPNKYAIPFSRIEPYGFFIVLALLWLPGQPLRLWMQPVMGIAGAIISTVLGIFK